MAGDWTEPDVDSMSEYARSRHKPAIGQLKQTVFDLGALVKKWILMILPFIFAASSFAAPDEEVVKEMAKRTNVPIDDIRQYYDACDSGVTRTMKICGSYHLFVEEVRLNKNYLGALDKAKELGQESMLVRAQKTWLAYRDTACSFEGNLLTGGGGSSFGEYVLSCKEDLTKERADRLGRYF